VIHAHSAEHRGTGTDPVGMLTNLPVTDLSAAVEKLDW